MNKLTARNALLVIGAWSFSAMLAWLVRLLLIPLNNRLTFRGDAGTVTMWVWLGLPDMLTAALAAATLVSVIETRKPLSWVGGLAALYLYAGSLNAWRQLAHGWQVLPRTPDYMGIAIQAIMPTLVCLVVGIWWARRFSGRRRINP
jgi:hypothetical protein